MTATLLPPHGFDALGLIILDALRRRDYDLACHEAEEYAPANFWKPLMRATALAHLGRRKKPGPMSNNFFSTNRTSENAGVGI